MLQITKASEVVPMSLYLKGRFFHGGQFTEKPSSCCSTSSPWSGRTLALVLDTLLWFSLMSCWVLHSTIVLCLWMSLEGVKWKLKRWNEVLIKGFCEWQCVFCVLWGWWKKDDLLCGLRVKIVILMNIEKEKKEC
jgi:hypothetical protein